MRSRKRPSHSTNDDEVAGWISMTDLFTLFAIVALAIGGANANRLNEMIHDAGGDWQKFRNDAIESKSEAAASQGRTRALEVELETLRKSAAEMNNLATGLKSELELVNQEVRRLQGLMQVAGSDADKAALIQSLQRKLSETLALPDQERLRAELVDKAALIESLQRKLSETSALADQERLRAELVDKAAKQGQVQSTLELQARTEQLLAARKQSEELSKELEMLRGAIAEQSGRLGAAQRAMAAAEADKAIAIREKASGGTIRQELLGLKGSLRRVVFVLDRSSSMHDDPARWQEAKELVLSWIKYLPVQEVLVILFDSEVRTLPNDGRWVDLTRDSERESLINAISLASAASGSTNTLAAIEQAFRCEGANAIVLFTDGKPDTSAAPSMNGALAVDAILACVKSQGSIQSGDTRLHTVGVGNYFEAGAGKFLLDLANAGSGSFIGR